MTYLVRQMGHVVLSSPDPQAAAEDLRDIVGLKVTETDVDTIYLSCNDRHHDVAYVKGDGAAVCVGMEAVDAAAVDEVYRRAKSDGLKIVSDQPLTKGYDRAVRVVAPGGAIFEIHTAVKRSEASRHNGVGARPRRLEHVNVFAPDTEVFGEFCEKTLGMKLSDRTVDGAFRWYRAQDGFHHTVAMGRGDSALHHYAFDVHSMQDLQRIADNLADKLRSLAWGPGRHGAGDNVFVYYADPHGCLVESSVEMRHIDNDEIYQPTVWDPDSGLRWINSWGTPPTPAFLVPGIRFVTA